jgi:hypothetical protein
MSHVPDVLPVLSRGKHRNPRRGACFMELASYLAGEKWSDRPACTHPLLAEVARNVNDRVCDSARRELGPLIPEVIGLTPDDPRVEARLALHCALVALPVAPFQRQRALAVAVLSCLRVLAALGDDDSHAARARRALDEVPDAARWAERFSVRTGGGRRAVDVDRFRRLAARDIVKMAARGVEEAAAPGRDALLAQMLSGAVSECRSLQSRRVEAAAPVDPRRWQEAVALTS